jgi:ribosome biogenesis GTPase / thiamine phosphate phosphatase
MKALVYKSTGSWYQVKLETGEMKNARIKGVFKIDGITSTNPIAVGDEVVTETENELEGSVMITEIANRRNYITRQSPSHKRQHHIVASNLDQSLLFATLKNPRTSQGFIDRYLVTCEAYHIPATVVFNKIDLYQKKEMATLDRIEEILTMAGYSVKRMSVATGEGIDDVKAFLTGRTTLLSGHSGVGKSSFINMVIPQRQLKTQEVSGWSGKGLHTTTFAEMFDLPDGGRIIDTPGMREFGIVDISKQELSHYYPEMRALISDCQFNNCLHVNEPGCMVKEAVMDGRISEDRYVSYVGILDTIEEREY